MTEKEILEKIEQLEKRVVELEKRISVIENDIYVFTEEDNCEGNCHCCNGCDDEKE